MDDFRQWLRQHIWVMGIGATAAFVFLVTFVSVSAVTGDDDADNAALSAPLPPGTVDELVVATPNAPSLPVE